MKESYGIKVMHASVFQELDERHPSGPNPRGSPRQGGPEPRSAGQTGGAAARLPRAPALVGNARVETSASDVQTETRRERDTEC
jgi:hypothetical protein